MLLVLDAHPCNGVAYLIYPYAAAGTRLAATVLSYAHISPGKRSSCALVGSARLFRPSIDGASRSLFPGFWLTELETHLRKTACNDAIIVELRSCYWSYGTKRYSLEILLLQTWSGEIGLYRFCEGDLRMRQCLTSSGFRSLHPRHYCYPLPQNHSNVEPRGGRHDQTLAKRFSLLQPSHASRQSAALVPHRRCSNLLNSPTPKSISTSFERGANEGAHDNSTMCLPACAVQYRTLFGVSKTITFVNRSSFCFLIGCLRFTCMSTSCRSSNFEG